MTLINSSLPVFNKKCRAGGAWKKKFEEAIKKNTEDASNKKVQKLPATKICRACQQQKVKKIVASKKDWDFPVQKLASSLVAAKELMER